MKEVIGQDVNYKDASLLLAQAIEYHRTAPRWWKSKWFVGGALVMVGTLAGRFAFRPESPVRTMLFTSNMAQPSDIVQITSEPVVITQVVLSDVEATVPPNEIVTSDPNQTPTEKLPYHWERLNSGQFLPRDQITTIVGDPEDPGVVYIGTQYSGVYKSIDGGLSWQPSHEGLDRAYITSLIIDPAFSYPVCKR